MQLLDLPLARYRLEFAVETPLHLPAFAGSTLRGAWGAALRKTCCMTKQPVCEGCALLATCPYASIFESRPAPGSEPGLQEFSQVPKPYIIEPPEMGERDYAVGDTLAFHMVLAGRALENLPLILWAMVRALRHGVGKGEGRAELARVVHVAGAEHVVLDSPEGRLAEHTATVPKPLAACGECLALDLHTPLRLQANGRRATDEEFNARRLLMALVRRVALLHEFHGGGPLALDFKDLARRAEAIESDKALRWIDPRRYSSRQQQLVPLGGVVGRWGLCGDLAPFLPFLHLGEWVHVGKEAAFGLGGYRLISSP